VTIKFLVTGGLGFIGQRVVHNLLARGVPTVSADYFPDTRAIADLRAAAGGTQFDALAMDVGDFPMGWPSVRSMPTSLTQSTLPT
jgi:nucleoside-diphosphate-sugar epimerase